MVMPIEAHAGRPHRVPDDEQHVGRRLVGCGQIGVGPPFADRFPSQLAGGGQEYQGCEPGGGAAYQHGWSAPDGGQRPRRLHRDAQREQEGGQTVDLRKGEEQTEHAEGNKAEQADTNGHQAGSEQRRSSNTQAQKREHHGIGKGCHPQHVPAPERHPAEHRLTHPHDRELGEPRQDTATDRNEQVRRDEMPASLGCRRRGPGFRHARPSRLGPSASTPSCPGACHGPECRSGRSGRRPTPPRASRAHSG